MVSSQVLITSGFSLASALIALAVQRQLDKRRERRARKLSIFRNLMTTRATPMSPQHIEALNSIEFEFYATGGKDKRVLDAWHLYMSHLNERQGETEAEVGRWYDKKADLLVDLIREMAVNLGYANIDKATVKDGAYYPQGHQEIEQQLHALRKSMLGVFSGKAAMPMSIVGPVRVEEPAGLAAQAGRP